MAGRPGIRLGREKGLICGARTRKGTPCKRKLLLRGGKCPNHACAPLQRCSLVHCTTDQRLTPKMRAACACFIPARTALITRSRISACASGDRNRASRFVMRIQRMC